MFVICYHKKNNREKRTKVSDVNIQGQNQDMAHLSNSRQLAAVFAIQFHSNNLCASADERPSVIYKVMQANLF